MNLTTGDTDTLVIMLIRFLACVITCMYAMCCKRGKNDVEGIRMLKTLIVGACIRRHGWVPTGRRIAGRCL
jgi:hypothetical protein